MAGEQGSVSPDVAAVAASDGAFQLKREDTTAPLALAHWIEEALRINVQHAREMEAPSFFLIPRNKIAGAARELAEMLEWQEDHRGAVKWPD